MEKLSLIKIKNPFIRTDRDIEVIEYQNQSLLDLRNIHFPQDIAVCISVNGKLIPEDKFSSTYPLANDQILFVPEITGGETGKLILRAVLMIVVAVLAIYTGGLALSAYGPLWGAIVTVGIGVVGGLIVNAILPPPMPKFGGDFDVAQSYSWNPQTLQQQGIVIPKFYGKNKLYGNIISAFIESEGEKKYCNALINLGLGPYNLLEEFKINDQSIDSYHGVKIIARYGDLDQEVIENFENTKNEFLLSKKITEDIDPPYIYATSGDAFDGLEIDITFPAGLWRMQGDGDIVSHEVDVKVEIKKEGGEWETITEQTISVYMNVDEDRWSCGRWILRRDESDKPTKNGYITVWHEDLAGSSDKYAHVEGDSHNEGSYWHWIDSSVILDELADVIVDYETSKGSQTSPIVKTFKVDNLTYGKYYIKVSNLTPDQTSNHYGDDMYFTVVREVYYDDFEYPRQVLVGIKALATDQLSGSLEFSCIAECSKINVYDGANWSVQYSNNPAWVAFDILTQPVLDNNLNILRYDGIDPSRLDIVKFKEWADFCDTLVSDGDGGQEKRITFNGGFDSEFTMWEAVMQVCQIGRAIPVWNGINLTVAIDQPSEPVQLFTVGNIGIDSFKETFLPMEDRAAELEIDFIDSEQDYERNKFTVINTAIDSQVNKVNLQLFGITKSTEAWRAGMYRLLCNQYLLRTIEFEADIDSIACTLGDVINLQHDIPQWGYGGRVVSATLATVTIDREVTIEVGKSYIIMIRLSTNDTIVEKSIANPPGTYTVLQLASVINPPPQQYDVYTFGEVTKPVKPFRVINIKRSQEQKATITAIEYNENIYTADTGEPIAPLIPYSDIETIQPVTGLQLSEVASINESGVINRYIVVAFNRPANSLYRSANIYCRETSNTQWYLVGNTDQAIFNIYNILPSTGYEILVQSIGDLGQKTLFSQSPSELITTGSDADFHNNALEKTVTGLQIYNQGNNTEFEGKDCKFVWDDITAVDSTDDGAGEDPFAGYSTPNIWLKDYEVTIKNTDEDETERRTEHITEPRYTYTYEKNYEDGNGNPVRSFTINVRARDRYYRTSLIPAKLTVSNPAPPVPTDIVIISYIKAFSIDFQPVNALDISGYLIFASQTSGFIPGESNLVNRGPDTHIMQTLSYGGWWYIRIAAYDTFGEDELIYSPEYSINILTTDPLDITPPAMPTGLSLSTGINLGNDGSEYAWISATWDANTEDDLAYYEYRIKETGGNYIYGYVGENEKLFSSVRANISHYVGLRAVDTWSNKSAWTTDKDIISAMDTTPPSVPTGLTAIAGFKLIGLKWNANTEIDLDSYEIQRSATGVFGGEEINLEKAYTHFFIDSELDVDTQYWHRIRAIDTSRNPSSWTIPVNTTTLKVGQGEIAVSVALIGELFAETAYIDELILKVNSLGETMITPGMIQVSGTTSLSDWRHGSDTTKIDGGEIHTNSIFANSLVIGSRNVSFQGIEISANSPIGNKLYWTAGVISYINDDGTPVDKDITGNPYPGGVAWSSGTIYLYWVKDATVLSTDTDRNKAFTADNIVIATYRGGADLTVTFGRTIVDGSDIVTGTIDCDRLKANTILSSTITVSGRTEAIGTTLQGLNSSGSLISKVLPGQNIGTPSGAGLFLGADVLGYFDASIWKVYIDNTGKFTFKGDADDYISWNGSTLAIRGTLNADDIEAGTITGITIQTAASGKRVVINDGSITPPPNDLRMYNSSNVLLAHLQGPDSGAVLLTLGTSTDSNMCIGANSAHPLATIEAVNHYSGISRGAGISGYSDDGPGIYGDGRYGVEIKGLTGAIILVPGAGAGDTVPTHSARYGTLWITNTTGAIYKQTAGGPTGTGSTWSLI